MKRTASKKEKEEHKRKHKMRIRVLKAARRSGNISKQEGKVEDARSKKRHPISQRRMATIKKSRY